MGKALIEIEVEDSGAVSTPEPVKETKKAEAVESSSSSSSEETGTVGRTKLS